MAVVVITFLVIGARLVQLQLSDARAYAERGLADRLVTEALFAPRGSIVDRYGNVLAQSVEARYVFADPSRISADQVPQIADALRPLLGVPASELVPKLSRKVRTDGSIDEFEYLARGVDVATGDQVQALNLPGIGVGHDELREEPGHDLAANLLGFVGTDGTGLAGLEAGYDSLLAGVDGSRTFEVGQGDLSTQIPGGYDDEKPAHPGSSLQLTIDRDLQYQVQQILAARMSAAHADWAAAVILDVHTGEVLAQASYPGYDAQNPDGAGATQLVDAASQVVVDPGSVHKVITLSAALQTSVIDGSSQITLPGGTITVGGQVFRDSHPQPPGTKISLPAILAYSSNVGTITIADRMPAQTLYQYQRAFGLGTATGEGLPAEAPGLVQPPQNWSGPSYGSIPIGEGVSVTPLQMAAVYATIANGGVYIAPHLVREIIAPDGRTEPTAAPVTRRVISATTAATLRTDLQAVVSVPQATGLSAQIPGYLVAGKTGTGQEVQAGRYAPGSVVSFIGMAPANAPRYVVAVFAHTPSGSGGTVAAQPFHDMMLFTLRHYQVSPSSDRPPAFAVLTQRP